jgi:hypothetical protein
MRTPAGTECPYYYSDFHRGRATQFCRLLEFQQDSLPWQPGDCKKCPVPGITSANASPHLRLNLIIKPILVGLGRRKQLTATCDRHAISLDDPYVGCPQCNAERPGLEAFKRALEETDD